MTEPKKSVRIFMFIGLITLNIILLAVVLQRTLPKPLIQAKEFNPTAIPVALDHQLYLPLAATVYQEAIVLLPGDGVYYERDQDGSIRINAVVCNGVDIITLIDSYVIRGMCEEIEDALQLAADEAACDEE